MLSQGKHYYWQHGAPANWLSVNPQAAAVLPCKGIKGVAETDAAVLAGPELLSFQQLKLYTTLLL